jgi:hypothetical protein
VSTNGRKVTYLLQAAGTSGKGTFISVITEIKIDVEHKLSGKSFCFNCFIIHMYIQCLGHFSPLPPPPPLPPTPSPPSPYHPSIPGRNYQAKVLIGRK